MTDILRPVKTVVKQTPLWPLLRPRRVHVFGIGAPKTGTHSVSRLFANYRSAHEAHPNETLQIIRGKREGTLTRREVLYKLRARDRKWRLEAEAAHFLIHLVDDLVELYPDAKFICTVREPRSWLRSIIDQDINKPRSGLPSVWRAIHDLDFGRPLGEYPSQEEILEEYELRSLDQYLSYWAWHNVQLLDTTPNDRRLFVRTACLSGRTADIAKFLDVTASHLDRSHSNKASEKHGILSEIDRDYVCEKICGHCSRVAKRLNTETSVSIDLP